MSAPPRRVLAARAAPVLAIALLACGGDDGATGVRFTDVTVAAGLPPSVSGFCLAFEDLDGDGAPDVLLPTGEKSQQTLDVYVNRKDGTFRRRTIAEPRPQGSISVCAVADLDNDGRRDVVVARQRPASVDVLWNQADGSFRTETLALGDTSAWDRAHLALADLDGDGRLDIVVLPFLPNAPSTSCTVTDAGDFICPNATRPCGLAPLVVLRPLDKGFVVAPATGLACPSRYTNAAAVVDWNHDGHPDLFGANDWGANGLYLLRDPAALAFDDVARDLHLDRYNHGMGAAFADLDGDGLLDLYVADLGPDPLYFGRGDGTLELASIASGVADATRHHVGWSPVAADFDLDGRVDVFVANSGVARDNDELGRITIKSPVDATVPQGDLLLHNAGGRRFEGTLVAAPARRFANIESAAVAIGDLDGDGDDDILETVGEFPTSVRLLRNDQATHHHWLAIRLVGHAANRDGVGAEIAVTVAGARHLARVEATTGATAGSVLGARFGLGVATTVEAIDVRWPGGRLQHLPGPLAIDRQLAIEEPR